MKFSSLKTNADTSARWVKDIPSMGNIELFLRPANNPDYRRRMQAMIRALPPNKRTAKGIDPVEMDRIVGVCLRDCSLEGWRNVEDDDGAAIQYSKDQADTFLTDPEWTPFREGVMVAADMAAEESSQADEETVGNSVARSVSP